MLAEDLNPPRKYIRAILERGSIGLAILALGSGVIAAGVRGSHGPALTVNADTLGHADDHPNDWMSYGRSYDEQRFSPLTQINDANAATLGISWYADIGLSRGEEATPIVVDGVMYISTPWSMVRAFDAASGKPLWQYDPEVPRDTLVQACCDAVNRGVAVWGNLVFVGTLDGRLVALNRKTGRPAWSVRTTDKTSPYTITGAPRVVGNGLVVIGNGGAELGVRGFVTAYDATTGNKVWRFYTVPGEPGKPDGEISDEPLAKAAGSWAGDAWWKMKAGGGTAWDAMAYDAKLGILYIGTGNGSPWNRAARSQGKGDNLFLSSIVALDAKTGRLVWHYQTTPGDEWDYTATQTLILADIEMAGRIRQVIMQAPKNGFFYILDRASGELLSAEKYVPVNWAERIDLKTGRPVENPAARYSETGQDWFGTPGTLGGHNWPPMAFSPKTGLVYIPAQNIALNYSATRDFKKKPMGYNTGVSFAAPQDPAKSPIKETKGYLLAWNPKTQREVWRAPRDTFGNGGVLTTAGNLVVQGTGTGYLKVMRADTGKEIWSHWLQTGVLAAPMTYSVKGKQYLAVLSGCGGVFGGACKLVDGSGRKPNLDRLVVFSLDGNVKLPPAPERQAYVIAPPTVKLDPAIIAKGSAHYVQYCAVCHGFGGVSVGNQPDLRFSPLLGDESWYNVLLDGALKDAGMASFSSVLTRSDAEAIQQYIIDLARKARDGQSGTAPVAAHGT